MESIEKLREIANTEMAWMEISPRDFVRIADEIEREIADKYMLLPVDADGVPIHVGENLRSACSETEYTALGFWFDFDCGIWQVMVSSKQAMSGNMLRHVKPRTVEDVLNELLDDYMNDVRRDDEDIIAKYAAELQMRGDAE